MDIGLKEYRNHVIVKLSRFQCIHLTLALSGGEGNCRERSIDDYLYHGTEYKIGCQSEKSYRRVTLSGGEGWGEVIVTQIGFHYHVMGIFNRMEVPSP
jgi:hypothetical protein